MMVNIFSNTLPERSSFQAGKLVAWGPVECFWGMW